MDEFGHITFLREQYDFDECKATFHSNRISFECIGPDIYFAFSKLRIRDASDASVYQDAVVSSETDDGDLGDYASFRFFDEEVEFDDPWEVRCLDAKPEKGFMSFEWQFAVRYGSGRIPKRKRMRGVARCSLTP